MSQHVSNVGKTFPANADLSANQHRFVSLTTAGKAQQAGAGAAAVGIQGNKPDAADRATLVALLGSGTAKLVTKTSIGGSIAVGDLLKSTSDGRGEKASSGDRTLVQALAASTADN
ncbi:MAG: hypothetical protein Q8Q29_07560, partial [Actinomycetota bacterium]|nr:hypothetical protein [Actinomycetota bacterium]